MVDLSLKTIFVILVVDWSLKTTFVIMMLDLSIVEVDCAYTNSTFCDETPGAIDRYTHYTTILLIITFNFDLIIFLQYYKIKSGLLKL